MSTFDTPEPISVKIDLVVGDVRITASERADTFVDVLPIDETDESDVESAERTHVEFANGLLLIKAARTGIFDFSSKSRAVHVTVDLPAGSQVHSTAAVGDFRCTGRLGECTVKTSTGLVQLERTGPLQVKTTAGDVSVDGVEGRAEITTGGGKLLLGDLDGEAVVKNTNGDTEIRTVTGDLRVRASNGGVSVLRAAAGVDAKTANGSLRVGEIVRGLAVLKTSMGDVEIGVAKDTAAWLDVNTGYGRMHNLLAATSAPEESVETVEVRAHTTYGDITVRRS